MTIIGCRGRGGGRGGQERRRIGGEKGEHVGGMEKALYDGIPQTDNQIYLALMHLEARPSYHQLRHQRMTHSWTQPYCDNMPFSMLFFLL